MMDGVKIRKGRRAAQGEAEADDAAEWRERAERAERQVGELKQELRDVRRTLRGLLNKVERSA